jgi:hypothetical protein
LALLAKPRQLQDETEDQQHNSAQIGEPQTMEASKATIYQLKRADVVTGRSPGRAKLFMVIVSVLVAAAIVFYIAHRRAAESTPASAASNVLQSSTGCGHGR